MKIQKKSISKPKIENPNSMNISITYLDIFCKYVITDPNSVSIANIANLNRMMNALDPKTYTTDPEKNKRVQFIMQAINARLNHNLTDRQMILAEIQSNLKYDLDFIDPNVNLSADDIARVNDTIAEGLKYAFVFKYVDKIIGVCTDIKTSDFDHRGQVMPTLEHIIDETKNEFRKATVNDDITDMVFSLDDGAFEDVMKRIYDLNANPNRRLVTGMQGLNIMTGGGLESSRCYVILGITGGGKSLVLLNLAYQIKKYNKTYQTKDPTKRPTVTYLTMENTVLETTNRLFDLVTESQYSMTSYSYEEVLHKMREEGQLKVTENSPIDITIIYKPNLSVDTGYLYTLYDNLMDQGKEMICLIQDHLMRIRSVMSSNEPRFELGNITNEIKTFGIKKDIPTITNFHLNRDAMMKVENSSKISKIDVTQKLGKSNVSESTMILNNCDVSIIINKDEDDKGQSYMGFNLIKMRDKTNLFYFAQPFAYNSTIRLIQDINGPAMYKEHLHGAPTSTPKVANIRTSSSNIMGSINNITSFTTPTDATFSQNQPTDIDEDEEETIIKPVARDPFIRGLPKVDPRKEAEEKMNDLKSKLAARRNT